MDCPNCKNPFAFESSGKHHCDTCGWFEYVDGEWHTCEAPEPVTPPEPKPPDPEPPRESIPPDPGPGPEPEPQVTEYLGGIVTVTEVDE